MWCCFSFSDILQSLKMYVFVILSSMGSTMLFFFLPRTLLYLCQNWFSSQDSFRNFVVFLLSFIFDSVINCWYSILAVYSISELAMLYLVLNVWLAFLSSFPDFLMSFLHQPLLSFFIDSVCPKKRVALFITSVSFFVWLSISSSVISVGNSSR